MTGTGSMHTSIRCPECGLDLDVTATLTGARKRDDSTYEASAVLDPESTAAVYEHHATHTKEKP